MQFSDKQRRLNRLNAEASLIAQRYGVNVRYDREDGTWLHVERLPIPPGWNKATADILIDIPHGIPGYPQVAPEWFWTNRDLATQSGRPVGHFFKLGNQGVDEEHWRKGFGHFCIHLMGWRPAASFALEQGDTMLSYLRVILQVFQERRYT